MASRSIEVKIIGDPSQIERAFGRAGASAKGFSAQMEQTRSHVLNFAKATIGFGAAFAGFEGLKSAIGVVLDAQASMSKLDQALRNAHASVKLLTPAIQEYEAAGRQRGFTDDQTRESLAKLVTAFGATKQALGEVSVAADLARARNLDLSSATQQLILLQEGNARAAKALGVVIPDLTKAQWEAKASADGLTLAQEKGKVLYDELLPRIKAQSDAYAATPAGKIAEFHAQVTHLEEAIGQQLLPVVDHYLTAIDDWLSKSSNQKKVTDDVHAAIKLVTGAIHDAEGVMKTILPVVDNIAKGFGGWKTLLEDLAALKIASMLSGWATGFKTLGLQEEFAATRAKGLYGWLGGLKAMGPIGVVIALSLVRKNATGQRALDKLGLGFLGSIPIIGGAETQVARAAVATHNAIDSAAAAIAGGRAAGPAYPTPKFGESLSDYNALLRTIGSPTLTAAEYAQMRGYSTAHVKTSTTIAPPKIGAGGPSIYGPSLTGGGGGGGGGSTRKAKKPSIITGSSLLPAELARAIDEAASSANASQGAVALTWLRREHADLEQARKDLEARVHEGSKKQQEATRNELTAIDGKLKDVGKKITENLKAQADAIRHAFASKISTATSDVNSAWSRIQNDLDNQLQRVFQKQISELGARFYQGTQTPLEAKLAGMQAADTKQGLQDSIDTAKKKLAVDQADATVTADQLTQDQQTLDQAQRQYDENELAIQATADRAQRDKDYAAALQTLQDQQALQLEQLNDKLTTFGTGLASGKTKIGDLNTITDTFGLTLKGILDPNTGIGYDFQGLGSATQALAQVMRDEAANLRGMAASVTSGLGGAGGYRLLNPLPRFASGGVVTQPTIALIGEAGPEAVVPLSRRGSVSSGGGGDLVIKIAEQEFLRISKRVLLRDKMRNGTTGIS